MKKLIPVLLAFGLICSMAIGMVGCEKDPVNTDETTGDTTVVDTETGDESDTEADSTADTTDTAPESETDATTESDVTPVESDTVTEAVEETTGETETAE